MSFFDPYEHERGKRLGLQEKAERLRDNLSPAMVATHLGCKWSTDHKKIICPSHKGGRERTPSLGVFPDHFYCYMCRKWWDVISFTAFWNGSSWWQAVEYLTEEFDSIMSENKRQEVYYPTSAEYRGPVPPDMVYYWHDCLGSQQRGWLHEQRLLTDETIDTLLIGWRADWNAYTIPFWRGEPRRSEIDIIQYRMIDHPKGIRYIGMRGYNRPSIINRHRIGTGSVLLLFGTFDAILCSQDGIAAVSTNGATSFLRNHDNLTRLRQLLHGSVVYILPDKHEDEARAAHLLAGALHASVRYFPVECKGKDYTEMRLAGCSSGQIVGEAVMGKENWLIKDDGDDALVLGILQDIAAMNEQAALEKYDHLCKKYVVPIINQHLQVRMQFDPVMSVSHSQWEMLRQSITNKLTVERLAWWIRESVALINRSKGGF